LFNKHKEISKLKILNFNSSNNAQVKVKECLEKKVARMTRITKTTGILEKVKDRNILQHLEKLNH
jgi:hypothetical protein